MSPRFRKYVPVCIVGVVSMTVGFVVSGFLFPRERDVTGAGDGGAAHAAAPEQEGRLWGHFTEAETTGEMATPHGMPASSTALEPGEMVPSVLTELRDLAKHFSGTELRQRQTHLLLDTVDSGKLTSQEKVALMKQVHSSVADSVLPMCWRILASSAVADPDFQIRNLMEDFPPGRLGDDLLANAGLMMATGGMKISRDDLSLIQGSVNGIIYQNFMASYIQGFAKADAGYVMDLLRDHGNGLDDERVSMILIDMESPEAFVKLAETDLIQQEMRNGGGVKMKALVSGWADVSPDAAAVWVSGIGDPAMKGAAAESLVKSWSKSDLNGAAKWLASSDLQGMDGAISALMDGLSNYTPAEARQWAERIQDEQLRQRALDSITQQ